MEAAHFYKILNFVENTLSKGELNKYFPYNIKSRRYLCPKCTYWLNKHELDESKPKWSFLKPNKPNAKTIECLVCDKTYNVIRKDCEDEDCKGNVLNSDYYEDLCLTCFGENYL